MDAITMDVVDNLIRAAVVKHVRKAKHPNEDTVMDCETCTALLTLGVTLGRLANIKVVD